MFKPQPGRANGGAGKSSDESQAVNLSGFS